MKIGQAEASENALRRLRGEKADISQETADIKVILLRRYYYYYFFSMEIVYFPFLGQKNESYFITLQDYTERSKRVSGEGILSVFQRKYSHSLIVSH